MRIFSLIALATMSWAIETDENDVIICKTHEPASDELYYVTTS